MQRRKNRYPLTGTYSILFDLDEKSDKFFKKLSKDLKKDFETEITFEGERYYPHITLYIFSAPLRNSKRIIETVRLLSSDIKSLDLKVKDLILSRGKWVIVVLREVETMRKYHELSVKLINPLRENTVRRKYRNMKFVKLLLENEQKNLVKYGDSHVFDLFFPHVSLAKVPFPIEVNKIIGKYKAKIIGKKIKTISLSLIRDIGGINGRSIVLYKKDLN